MNMWDAIRTKLHQVIEKKRAKQHSLLIDRQIRKDRDSKSPEVKCLLFGKSVYRNQTETKKVNMFRYD